MNYLTQIRAITIISAGAFTFAATHADAGEKLKVKYDINYTITTIAALKYTAELSAKSYNARVKIKPVGLASFLKGLDIDLAVEGLVNNSNMRPLKFKNVKIKKSKKDKIAKVNWSAGGVPKTERNYSIKRRDGEQINKAITAKQGDPLTALMRAGTVKQGKPCASTEVIYDGKDIYQLRFKLIENTTFDKKSGGVYRGPASHCRVEYLPLTGKSEKKLAKARANPQVFDIWYATVRAPQTSYTLMIPVKATGELKGRNFTALTNKAKLSGKDLSDFVVASK